VQRLYYFDADIRTALTLSDQLRIRRVKKSEKQSYGEFGDNDQGLGWGFGGPLSFVLECVSPTQREGEETMKKLAVCLLLFKHDMGLDDRLPWFRLVRGRSGYWQSDHLPPLTDEELDDEAMRFPGYRLGIADIDAFRTFWATCSKTSWHKSLLLAGSRLLLVQARRDETALEDRLIDLMIACEALVIEDKKEDKKRTKIARRVGKLQEEQIPHLAKRASEELGLAYRLRNDLVHQGEFSSENLAEAAFPDQFVMYIEQYLRIGMANYIDLMNQGKSKNQIIQYLDESP